jgi:hypothetical protein
MLNENPVWAEKYRPKTIEDIIAPDFIKKTFMKYRDGGDIPNLIINSGAGTGKCLDYDTSVFIHANEDFLQKLRDNNINFRLTGPVLPVKSK